MKSSRRYLILIKRLFQPVYSEVEKLIASSNRKCFLTNSRKDIYPRPADQWKYSFCRSFPIENAQRTTINRLNTHYLSTVVLVKNIALLSLSLSLFIRPSPLSSASPSFSPAKCIEARDRDAEL